MWVDDSVHDERTLFNIIELWCLCCMMYNVPDGSINSQEYNFLCEFFAVTIKV